MIGRRASLVALSLLGLGEAARWSGQQAAPSRGKFGLPSLDTMKEKLPKIELPWSRVRVPRTPVSCCYTRLINLPCCLPTSTG